MYLIAFAGLAMVFLVYFFFSKTKELYIIARVKAAGNKITKNYEGVGIYYGQMEGGKRHGYGTYTFASGSKYVGEFKNGKFNGNGTQTASNGDKCVGEFKDDLFHGTGTKTWADGRKYIGEWRDNQQNGPGTFTNADGTILHSGEWVNDKPFLSESDIIAREQAAEEKFQRSNKLESDILARVEAVGNKITHYGYGGDEYYGQMEGGKMHGQGTYTLANGTIYHSGEWVNDKPKK